MRIARFNSKGKDIPSSIANEKPKLPSLKPDGELRFYVGSYIIKTSISELDLLVLQAEAKLKL